MPELLAVALFAALVGLLLVVASKRWRAWRGFSPGKTVALDDVTLFSKRLGLVGRPDRIVKEGKHLIPEEWKSAKRVSHGHRLQVIAYCLLIEDAYGKRPPYGVVVNDGRRVVVENTEELRSEVLAIAEQDSQAASSPQPRNRGTATAREVPGVRAPRKLQAGFAVLAGRAALAVAR